LFAQVLLSTNQRLDDVTNDREQISVCSATYATTRTMFCMNSYRQYELRTRAHNREIPCRAGSLSDSNFITRM